MKKNIYFILLISMMLIFNVYNVKALDMTCKYKNGSDIAILTSTYDTSAGSDQYKYTIQYNSNTKLVYPANAIISRGNNQYELDPYNCYIDNKGYCTQACPNELYIAFESNSLLEKKVFNYISTIDYEHTSAIVFFSEKGFNFDKTGLTNLETKFLLYSPQSGVNYLKQSDFSGKIKTFTLNKNQSSVDETPQESNEDIQYCYYKNWCGRMLTLEFHKFRPSKLNNKTWSEWLNESSCPKSISEVSSSFKGSNNACQGSNSKNCYEFYKQSPEPINIASQDTCDYVEETGEAKYVLINGSGATIIVSYTNSDVASERLKITLNLVNITVSNASNYISSFASNDSKQYPQYIIKEKNTNNYSFATTIPSNSNDYNVYMLSSKVNALGRTELGNLDLNKITATCEQLFGGGDGGFMTFLKENVFKIIYIAVPIILLVLTTIDFSKVVFNDDKDGIKNAWKRFGKRAIAAILIYLTPTILIFIADVIGADDVNSCIKAIQNMDKSS